jgi:PAS domain S-box-containing protein
MNTLSGKTRLSRRSVVLAMVSLAVALGLLCVLFILGRPWAPSEYDDYRIQLSKLREHSAELEDDILRTRLGMKEVYGSSAREFALLRARAEALRAFPAFLPEEGREQLDTVLTGYLRALAGCEELMERVRMGSARLDAQRSQLTQHALALASEMKPGEVHGRLGALPLLEEPELALVASQPGPFMSEPLPTELVAEARAILDQKHQVDSATLALLGHSTRDEADRLILAYLQLYEKATARGELSRTTLFAASMLLGGFMMLMLVRVGRAGKALNALNAELERRVTERTAALSAVNAELRDNAARKAAILEGSLDCIITLDEASRILEFNPAAEHTFRLSSGAAVGRDFQILAMPSILSDSQREAVMGALRSDAEPGHAMRMELPVMRADGSLFPAEMTVFRVRGGGPPLFSIYLRDITERKEVERMKNEFISTVSHELRTPLTSIRGSLGLVEGGIMGAMPAPALDMVRIARTNSDRLIRLINDILDLEKIEAGKMELKLQPLEVSELVDVTFGGLRAVADAAQVTLRSSTLAASLVRGDRDRLIQVLTNLVSNAIKFSPPMSVVVVKAARDARGSVRFSVIDRGPGIPAEHRRRLFGKFQQMDGSDSRSKGGTGLGLAISQSLVEQHGGRIEVHSEPGKGATFTFAIPAMSMDSVSSLPVVRDDSRHNVLVVTADTQLSGTLRGLLKMEGYRVLRTTSLNEAQQMIEAGAPEVLVLDSQLPDGSGLELMKSLREDARTHELPIIMVSPHLPESEGVSTPLPVDWLVKPFDEARFLTTLRFAVRRPGEARVLVVEDDPSLRRMLSTLLGALGARCYEATDGDSAVALSRETPPDLIILDVGLPRMDGFEVVDILRQGKSRATPLLVFTGRELSAEDLGQLTLGITRHLNKARASEEQLVHTVKELLNGLLAHRADEPGQRKAAS